MVGDEIVNDGNGSQGVGVGSNAEVSIEEPFAGTLRDLGLEALDNLPLMLEEREVGEEAAVVGIVGGVVGEEEVHVPGTDVPSSGLEEHRFVEAAPDVLGGIDEVLDPAGDAVDPRTGRIAGGGGGGGRPVGEGRDGGADGGQVGGDGTAGALHEDDGVRGVDEVPVTGSYQETELLLLLVNEFTSRPLHTSDLRDGFGTEEGFRVPVAAAGQAGLAAVIGSRCRGYSHLTPYLQVQQHRHHTALLLKRLYFLSASF